MWKGLAALAAAFLVFSAARAAGHRAALSVSGSTALLPLADRAAGLLQAKGVGVTLMAGGSLFGLAQVRSGAVDIALSEAPPPKGLWHEALGFQPVTVICHRGVGVRTLSLADVRALLLGAVGRWSQIGGRAVPLVLFFRTPPSGVRLALAERLLGGSPPVGRSVNALSNGDVVAGVLRTPGSVGFVEGAVPQGPLQVLKVAGRLPGDAGYPLRLEEYAVMRRPPGPRARLFVETMKALLR